MHFDPTIQDLTRRSFFSRTSAGLGAAALASLQASDARARNIDGRVGGRDDLPHHEPKARRAIYLFMSGAPSQLDMWDPKPTMTEWFDKDLPDSIRQGQRLTTMTSGQARFPIAPSIYKFSPHGEAGTMISELIPHMAAKVDEIAVPLTVPSLTISAGSQPGTAGWPKQSSKSSRSSTLTSKSPLTSPMHGSGGGPDQTDALIAIARQAATHQRSAHVCCCMKTPVRPVSLISAVPSPQEC